MTNAALFNLIKLRGINDILYDPLGIQTLAEVLYGECRHMHIGSVGSNIGPLITAFQLRFLQDNTKIPGFLMIDGICYGKVNSDILILDLVVEPDILVWQIKALESRGHSVKKIICVFEGHEGGIEGYDYKALFKTSDFE